MAIKNWIKQKKLSARENHDGVELNHDEVKQIIGLLNSRNAQK